MTTRLPFWYGQPRGAGLASLAAFEPEEQHDESPDFLTRLWDRLFGSITDSKATFIGFSVILMSLAIGVAGAQQAPLAAGLLAFAACAWLATGAVCAWYAATRGDSAPLWVGYLITGLAGLGRVVVVTVVIGTIVAVVFAIVMLLVGAAMSDRRS